MNINNLVKKHDFRFSKKYGQNFIGDENLLAAIVADAGITDEDFVVEIGAGAGTLTRQIALKAKRVVAFEIDRSLEPILSETLEEVDNCEVIFGDIMDFSAEQIDALGGKFKVVANLPYYITTPIMFKLLECKNLLSATVMVQKEVAERICASENTPDYGSLTVAIGIQGQPKITRIVGRSNFTPPPNVDSAIVRVDVCPREGIVDAAVLEKLTRAAFAMRRKTLVNNLMSGMGLSRATAEEILTKANLPVMVRGEAISIEKFIELSNLIAEMQ